MALILVLIFMHLFTLVAYMVHSQRLINKIMSRDFKDYQAGLDITKYKPQSPPMTDESLYEVRDFEPFNVEAGGVRRK